MHLLLAYGSSSFACTNPGRSQSLSASALLILERSQLLSIALLQLVLFPPDYSAPATFSIGSAHFCPFCWLLFVPFCPCSWEERPGFFSVENTIRTYYYSIATKTENGPKAEDKSKAAFP